MDNVDHDSHIFFITAQGYAGDHWFSWLPKALNAHPEMFVYLANEGSRPKYFSERSRSERPNIVPFTKFISDVCRTYTAAGDCYSYRANQLQPINDEFGDRVRRVNIIRHPYVWLYFYLRWRTTNMRMGTGETKPIDHEWSIVQHELYKGLKPYAKEDVHIWAFYRGLTFLSNHMMRDFSCDIKHIKLEDIVTSQDCFIDMVSYLTHGRVTYTQLELNTIYSWLYRPFRGEDKLYITPKGQRELWESWQITAFEKIVSKEAIAIFKEYGYEFY